MTTKDTSSNHDQLVANAKPTRSLDLDRRTFLGTLALSGSVLAAPWSAQAAQVGGGCGVDPALWVEASIPQLQTLMRTRRLTSGQLVLGYLERIDQLDKVLHSVIETNRDALAIASQRDRERHAGRVRGPLHGIPILVKDTIATNDSMETTAGSLALVGSRVPADARLVARLRDAGAIILGKANLTEWALRGFGGVAGWSARGGFTRNPYLLDLRPGGSSTGSAVATAANLCAAAMGVETDGSIIIPSSRSLVVGLKPTHGLVSMAGTIPLAPSQDAAGPIARTVTDAAVMLSVLAEPGVHPRGSVDYLRGLRRGALRGTRIGVDRQYFDPASPIGPDEPNAALVEAVLPVLTYLGATLVETNSGDPNAYGEAEFIVITQEFKVAIAHYLRGLRRTSMRTLADLIAFNIANCRAEMRYFGQQFFELAETTNGNLRDPDYLAARALCLSLARAHGIDAAMARDNLDAIVAPSYSASCTPAAVAGYPNISLPIGLNFEGSPTGLSMYAGAFSEARLLALAYDLEQELQARSQPQLLNQVRPEPPDAGLCNAPLALAPNARAFAPRGRTLMSAALRERW